MRTLIVPPANVQTHALGRYVAKGLVEDLHMKISEFDVFLFGAVFEHHVTAQSQIG